MKIAHPILPLIDEVATVGSPWFTKFVGKQVSVLFGSPIQSPFYFTNKHFIPAKLPHTDTSSEKVIPKTCSKNKLIFQVLIFSVPLCPKNHRIMLTSPRKKSTSLNASHWHGGGGERSEKPCKIPESYPHNLSDF